MPELWLIAGAGVVAGTAQSVSGFGLSIVLAPVLQLGAPGASGVRVTNAVASVSNTVLLTRSWRSAQLRAALLMAGPAVVVGLALTPLIGALGERTVSVVAALATLVAVLLALADRSPAWFGGDRGAVAAGAMCGALTVASGAGGPPLAAHVGTRDWSARTIVATVQLVALPNNVAAVLASGAALPGDVLGAALGGVAVGVPLGLVVRRRLTAEVVRRAVLLIGLAGSLLVLARALV